MGTTEREPANSAGHPNSVSILRIADVTALTGLSRVTVWRLERQGHFPARRKLTAGRAVGWMRSEIEAWISTRIAVVSEASRSAALA